MCFEAIRINRFKLIETLSKITAKHTLRVRSTMILGSVSNFSNTLKETKFQVLEILETLLKITTKCTLNLKLSGVLSFFLVVNFYLFIYLIIIIVICLGCFVNPP